jgi:hypothetical protein
MNKAFQTSLLRITLALATTAILASCSASVDMPQGKRGDYQSARLIQRNPNALTITKDIEKQVHTLIQNSLQRQFTSNGMSYGKSDAELAVGYLVIYQEPGMTANFDDFFGYGRNAREIADVAHIRGSIESNRPDYFRQAGIVVDVIDNRTGKLVFRNFAKGDVIQGASASTRAARIDQAVASALSPFFP